MRERFRIAAATSILWALTLTSCAAVKVKWWFLDGREELALIRRHSDSPTEKQSFKDSDGYICSSPADWEVVDQCMKICAQ